MALEQYAAAAAEYEAGAAILRRMIEQQMQVDQSTRDLAAMHEAADSARNAVIALGDWETLLGQATGVLPAMLNLRGLTFGKKSRFLEASQAAAKLTQLEHVDSGH
jgi:hypothetical protein